MIDPVGMQDIARRLTEQTGREVKFGTVRGWKSRGVLPPPLPQTIAGSPVWEWADIAAWAKKWGVPRSPGGVRRKYRRAA